MDKLFLTVLNMSLTGTIVIAAVCIARLPLKKAPKIISYCLWAVVAFRLICPFSIESAFSLLPINTQAIPPDMIETRNLHIDSGIGFLDDAVNFYLKDMGPEMRGYPVGSGQVSHQIYTAQEVTNFFMIIWLIGLGTLSIYGVTSYIFLKRKMSGSAHIESNIYESGIIESPFVLGVLNPRIYLPVGLSEKERWYVVLHEQTHIKRRDYIVKFAAYFILCLHWFNPLAWVAFLLMGVDMEMSCDERVLGEMGFDTKKDYSLSLLSLATERRFVSGSPLAFGEGGVKERIKRVLSFKKPSRVIIIAAIALAMVLIAGFAVNRISGDNPSYSEIAELINATQDEVYQKLGNPQETLNSTDIFIINGKTIHITYDENTFVEQINYNGEVVVNTSTIFSTLTLDDVRELAAKGDALQASDLPNLHPSPLSSTMGGYNPTLYGVEGGYRLLVSFIDTTNPESGIRIIQLESIWQNGGSGIDIRYNDVDEFIRMNPSHPADTVPSTTFAPNLEPPPQIRNKVTATQRLVSVSFCPFRIVRVQQRR